MLKRVFQRMFAFIVQPADSWESAAEEERDADKFLSEYLYPVLGLITLAAFVGAYWAERSFEVALKASIREFTAFFAGFYLASFLLQRIAERKFEKVSLKHCQYFTAYSSSLIYVVSMAGSVTNGFGLFYLFLPYTIYIIWEGALPFMRVQEDRQARFTAFATIVLAAPYLISFIINKFMLIAPHASN